MLCLFVSCRVASRGVAWQRLLFCSSHIGQVALVRQLAPSLHIGGEEKGGGGGGEERKRLDFASVTT